MRNWTMRIVVLAALIGVGLLSWRFFFPSPEQAIRKRLGELARMASFSTSESGPAKLWNAEKLSSFCTTDVEMNIDIPGRSRQTFSGRQEVLQTAVGARSMVSSLQIEFLDVTIAVNPDKVSAVVNLTGRGKIPGEKDFLVQELKFTLKKVEGDWLINRIETVKTLY